MRLHTHLAFGLVAAIAQAAAPLSLPRATSLLHVEQDAAPRSAQVRLEFDGVPSYDYLSRDVRTVQIDLRNVALAPEMLSLRPRGDFLESLQFSTENTPAGRVTRLDVRARQASAHRLYVEGRVLWLVIESGPTPAAPPSTPRDALKRTAVPAPSSSASEPPATRVHAVTTRVDPDAVEVRILGDGGLQARIFTLRQPDRLVVDVTGVRVRPAERTIPVDVAPVRSVRVAQFATGPEPVVRVVIDLTSAAAHERRDGPHELRLRVARTATTR